MSGARTFERPEPRLRSLARATWQLLTLFVLGPAAGVFAHGIVRSAGEPDPGRWALGTGLGVAATGFALGALWERAARRRYGRVRLTPVGASFERAGREPLELYLGQLELDEVTEHGVLLAPRDASRWSRWSRPLLVPTSGPAESEALVGEITTWCEQDTGPGTLRLRVPAAQVLVTLLVATLPFVGPVAMVVVGDGWSWSGLLVWLLSLLDLAVWILPLGVGVRLLPGTVAFSDERHALGRVRLLLAPGRWLEARDAASGQLLGLARLSPSGAAALRARLGDRLELPGHDDLRRARRRGLLRALLLLGLGTALFVAALRGGAP